ncbi:MAG: clan AA aspartic protease [Promethearchaeota archaeon]|nr:MAG: clan AA aspartic protease [Candidatus Lokiarchaeota archaeon]
MKFSYKKPQISEIEAPFIPIKISDMTKITYYPKDGTIDALIDTGYDGFLIVPFKIFKDLKLISSEFPEDQVPRVETITGENIELRTAIGNVEIPKLNIQFFIEIDTIPECSEILIGRQFLEKFIITLNGLDQELEIQS